MLEDLTYLLRIHALVGVTALISFWVAALSRKGSVRHVTGGRIFLVSMIFVLATTIPIILHFYKEGDVKRAMTLVYLSFVVVSAITMIFFSIRRRDNLAGYRNILYKSLGIFMTLYGLFVFSLGLQNPLLVKKLLLFGFASIGLVIGISMLQLAWSRNVDQRWWLRQHLNGGMIAFIATHASFLGLGLKKLVPFLAGEWMHTGTQLAAILLGYFLRIYLGRKLLAKFPLRKKRMVSDVKRDFIRTEV